MKYQFQKTTKEKEIENILNLYRNNKITLAETEKFLLKTEERYPST